MAREVIATRTGLYGGRVRQEGERFEIAREEDRGAWMADVKDAEGIPRVYDKHSSPARAEVGPNEALAYAEAGQLTTSLNIQLDVLRNENAHLLARLAEAEAKADALTIAGDGEPVDVGKSTKAALKATDEKLAELEKAREDADVHKSEDEDAVEAADEAHERAATEDEAKEKAEANSVEKTEEATRPTRRRRG